MRLLCATAALLATGCLGAGDLTIRNTLDFDFNEVGADHFGGVADFPQSQAPAVGLLADLRPLPDPLNPNVNALYLSATSVGGDLFMYQKKHWSGLPVGATYRISVQLEFATSYHAGCTTGPGPVAFVKMGVTTTEPIPVVDDQGVLRMNIDKGAGPNPGTFVQLGDIRNTLTGCPAAGTFGLRTTTVMVQPTEVVTDLEGGFWVFFGVQSSSPGPHEIYFTAMRLILETQN